MNNNLLYKITVDSKEYYVIAFTAELAVDMLIVSKKIPTSQRFIVTCLGDFIK